MKTTNFPFNWLYFLFPLRSFPSWADVYLARTGLQSKRQRRENKCKSVKQCFFFFESDCSWRSKLRHSSVWDRFWSRWITSRFTVPNTRWSRVMIHAVSWDLWAHYELNSVFLQDSPKKIILFMYLSMCANVSESDSSFSSSIEIAKKVLLWCFPGWHIYHVTFTTLPSDHSSCSVCIRWSRKLSKDRRAAECHI